MAASTECSNEMKEQDIFNDLMNFETDVDETEALNDVEQLMLSDDEVYLDIDLDMANLGGQNDPVATQACSKHGKLSNASIASNDVNLYKCTKCPKKYKTKTGFNNHVAVCTGKRKKVKATNEKRKRDDRSDLSK